MTTRQLLITLVVLVILGAIALGVRSMVGTPTVSVSPSPTPVETGVMCTMEAKMCADGSYVGRVPPTCEFAACPVTSGATSTKTVWSATMGQKIGPADLTITPLEVKEDSRCPADVQCIQAGTVRVTVDVAAKNVYSQHVLKLGEALTIAGKRITLTEVNPAPRAGSRIAETDYRFTFEIR